MRRALLLVYGLFCYLIGMAGLASLVLLLQGWGFSGMAVADTDAVALPLLVDLGLLALFGVSHSWMARGTFKARLGWSPAAERSTYVLMAGCLALALAAGWQPLPDALWQLAPSSTAGLALSVCGWVGWLIVLATTFMVSHADLFGLRQAWLQWRWQPYAPIPFRVRAFYRFVRHPMMTGMLIAFWCTPDMTTSRLVFAAGMTVYIGIGLMLEEAELRATLGASYEDYCAAVPMLLPLRGPVRIRPAAPAAPR